MFIWSPLVDDWLVIMVGSADYFVGGRASDAAQHGWQHCHMCHIAQPSEAVQIEVWAGSEQTQGVSFQCTFVRGAAQRLCPVYIQ